LISVASNGSSTSWAAFGSASTPRSPRSIPTGTSRSAARSSTALKALDYSRQRYGLESGDYDRQRHNQQLLKAIFSTALDGGIANNPIKIDQFIRALGASLTLDTGGATLTDVLLALRNLRPTGLVGVTVPSYPEMIGDESFILLNEEAPQLFDALHRAALSDWALDNPQWVHSL
jgi:hypothetical protein